LLVLYGWILGLWTSPGARISPSNSDVTHEITGEWFHQTTSRHRNNTPVDASALIRRLSLAG
jgi:hypothetical protein